MNISHTKQKGRMRGFTLIELSIVIAIVGVLASVVVTNLQASRYKADDARRDLDLREMRTAMELYGQKNGLDYSGLAAPDADECQLFRTIAAKLVQDGYLSDIPRDPRNTDAICYHAYMTSDYPEYGTIVAAYAYKWQKYGTSPANKKTGFVVSTTGDIATTGPITCSEFSYPIYEPDQPGDECNDSDGQIADKVIGVTEGYDE